MDVSGLSAGTLCCSEVSPVENCEGVGVVSGGEDAVVGSLLTADDTVLVIVEFGDVASKLDDVMKAVEVELDDASVTTGVVARIDELAESSLSLKPEGRSVLVTGLDRGLTVAVGCPTKERE